MGLPRERTTCVNAKLSSIIFVVIHFPRSLLRFGIKQCKKNWEYINRNEQVITYMGKLFPRFGKKHPIGQSVLLVGQA